MCGTVWPVEHKEGDTLKGERFVKFHLNSFQISAVFVSSAQHR